MRMDSGVGRAGVLCVIAVLLLSGCHPGAEQRSASDRPIIVTTFTILQDLVQTVVGDVAEVRTITPIGGEVHEWELIPSNFAAIEDAELIFYNGFGLEEWMRQVRATARPGVAIVAVAENSGYPTLPIRIGELEGRPDPHLWMSPTAAMAYVEVIRDALSEWRPDQAEDFVARATAAITHLAELQEEVRELLAPIPREQRVLITSEAAFLYFADAFDFEHDAIWGSNDEEEGTPRQIARIIDIIRAQQIPVAFYESTISDRHVRSVAEETGIRVAGPLFVDSLGPANSGVTSYGELLLHNARLISQELRP